jgi:hypothetical protein
MAVGAAEPAKATPLDGRARIATKWIRTISRRLCGGSHHVEGRTPGNG